MCQTCVLLEDDQNDSIKIAHSQRRDGEVFPAGLVNMIDVHTAPQLKADTEHIQLAQPTYTHKINAEKCIDTGRSG